MTSIPAVLAEIRELRLDMRGLPPGELKRKLRKRYEELHFKLRQLEKDQGKMSPLSSKEENKHE